MAIFRLLMQMLFAPFTQPEEAKTSRQSLRQKFINETNEDLNSDFPYRRKR